MDLALIEKKLNEGLSDLSFRAQDLSGNGDHFELFVATPDFQGKSRLEQHRMVMDLLKDFFDGPLHAVKIKTEVKKL